DAALELHSLGLGDPAMISALHGRAIGYLLDTIVDRLEELQPEARPLVDEDEIRVPNLGKSSLMNAILGRERVVVADQPGTTRDVVDTPFVRGDTRFRLIDTAGL